MTPDNIVVALLAGGGATIIVAVIGAFINRRKLSAEATQIISQAAAGTVENVMKDNANLRIELNELKAVVQRLEGIIELAEQRERIHMITEERYRWHMKQWHNYAAALSGEVRRLGGRVPDPPQQWPDPVTMGRNVDPHDQEL